MPAFRNTPFAVVLILNLWKDEMRRNTEDATLIYPPPHSENHCRHRKKLPFSCVTSKPATAETANIGAAGVDLGNDHLDAEN